MPWQLGTQISMELSPVHCRLRTFWTASAGRFNSVLEWSGLEANRIRVSTVRVNSSPVPESGLLPLEPIKLETFPSRDFSLSLYTQADPHVWHLLQGIVLLHWSPSFSQRLFVKQKIQRKLVKGNESESQPTCNSHTLVFFLRHPSQDCAALFPTVLERAEKPAGCEAIEFDD